MITHFSRGVLLGWLLAVFSAATTPAQELTFDRYHDSKATIAALESLVARYPDRIKIEVIGKSGKGQPIHAATITDFQTGRAEEKPAIFVEGNIHGNERVGGEAALRLIHRLVTDEQDKAVQELRRLRTFYVIPKANPDAADVWVRGILEPDDEDDDGKDDEDGPEDINGDGLVTYMRIVDPEGAWIPDLRDPRLMSRYAQLTVKERKRYRGLRYRVLSEGIDNDGDGEVNEDPPDWDIDPNRDFPADLKAERKFRKKYARTGSTRQGGRRSAGRDQNKKEFMRSVEVQATVKFLREHPSIALCISFHSYGNVLFRPFGYIPDRPGIPREDKRILDEIGRLFRVKTGFDAYGPPYLGERQVVGGLHDYTYLELGYPGVTAEIWGIPGVGRDWGERDQRRAGRNRRGGGGGDNARKMLEFIDRDRVKDAFVEWTHFEHPTLGKLEIGGLWEMSRFQYNPPPSLIQSTIDPFVEFAFEAAQMTPLVQVMGATSRQVKPRVFSVKVELMNVGRAPTTWKLATKRKLTVSDTVSIELPKGGRLSSGRLTRDVGTLVPGKLVKAQWTVVAPESTPCKVTVVLTSKLGGTERREVDLTPTAADN